MKKMVLLLGLTLTLTFGATIEEAKKAFDNKNYEVAFPIYEKLANQGDAEAQDSLGLMYVNGFGTKQDYSKAFSWYEKAANQGNKEAQYALGVMYEGGDKV